MSQLPNGVKNTQVAQLGRSVLVKGELTGSEDLTVDGRVEGRIDLPDHTLTIGPNAQVRADIVAKVVTVFGSVVGGVTARDKVEIRQGGSLEGHLACGRITIQDGAQFRGKVDMPPRQQQQDGPRPEAVAPALAAAM
jgi:cytoskeletal protein CcmA (bactofilin family)